MLRFKDEARQTNKKENEGMHIELSICVPLTFVISSVAKRKNSSLRKETIFSIVYFLDFFSFLGFAM